MTKRIDNSNRNLTTKNCKQNNSDITFNVDNITIVVHSPSLVTTDEDNKIQLAKYLYKLVEMNNKTM